VLKKKPYFCSRSVNEERFKYAMFIDKLLFTEGGKVRTKRTVSTLLIMLLLSYTATALMGTFLLQKATADEPTITMWVTPPTRVFEKGSTFNITIWLNDTADPEGPWGVMDWALTLDFDTSVIDYIGATEGPYLKKYATSTTFVAPSAHSIPVHLACLIVTGEPAAGPGNLTTVTFQVVGNGKSVIDLKETELIDVDDLPMLASSVDGTFYTTYPRAFFYYSPGPKTAGTPDGYPKYLSRDPLVGETITFNASAFMQGQSYMGSYDPDGTLENYEWDFKDGDKASGDPVVTHSYGVYRQEGYTVNLTVTDNEGKKSWYAIKVTPIKRDVAVSSIQVDPAIASPGEEVFVQVNITNHGSGSEYVNVTLYHNSTLIWYNQSAGKSAYCSAIEWEIDPKTGSPTKVDFVAGESMLLNYTWTTTGVPSGNYTIWANISQTEPDGQHFLRDVYLKELDLNPANNNLTWGNKVWIKELPNIKVAEINLSPTLKSPNIVQYGIIEVVIRVKVANTGDFNETFFLMLHQDTDLLMNWTDQFLQAKTSMFFEYQWNTETLPRGQYNLIAQASNVTDEVVNHRTGDNKLTLQTIITSAPVATFTYSPAKPLVGDKISVDASASYAAPSWSISTYTWLVNATEDKTLKKAAGQLSQLLQNRAIWNVTLIVTDNATVSSSLSQLIRVGSLPVAQFTFTPTAPKADQAIAFNASLSTPDTAPIVGDQIKTYNWDFGDGTKVVYTGANLTKATTHSYAKSGNFSVTLKVFDGDDFNATITKSVLVAKITSGVTVSLNAQTIEVGQSVTISGQVTPTRLGAKVSILYKTDTTDWALLQNVTSDQAGNYQHIWTINTVGNYTVKSRFTADDKYTGSESQTATIQVQSTPPPPPPPPTTPDWTPYIIAGGIAIIIVIAVAVYLMRRRK